MNPVILLYGSFGLNIIFFILLLLIVLVFRGMLIPTIKAKLKKSTIFQVVRKDGNVSWLVGEGREIAGTRVGEIVKNGEGIYTLPNGIATGLVWEGQGLNLSGKFISAIHNLRKAGFENWGDLKKFSDKLNEYIDSASGKLKKKLEKTKKMLQLEEVVGFFRYNMSPSVIRGRIEQEIQARKKERGEIPLQFIVTLVMVTAVVIIILWQMVFKKQIPVDTCLALTKKNATGVIKQKGSGGILSGIV